MLFKQEQDVATIWEVRDSIVRPRLPRRESKQSVALHQKVVAASRM